jgi:hypothetical protein
MPVKCERRRQFSLEYLAVLYGRPGVSAEAEPLFKRALAPWEKALGSERSKVATCLETMHRYCKPLVGRKKPSH